MMFTVKHLEYDSVLIIPIDTEKEEIIEYLVVSDPNEVDTILIAKRDYDRWKQKEKVVKLGGFEDQKKHNQIVRLSSGEYYLLVVNREKTQTAVGFNVFTLN